MREGNIDKEYITGRRDQYDLDLTTFWESVKETRSREDLIKVYRDKMSLIISRLAFERARNLQREIELIDNYYHED
ncbi:MAG: hypothetical protein AMDU3_IPLC00004G0112 [Thermoplasmatales archaeon I-plasma]|jgi:hypothetical protein|nr:MAG: hypothetical protein AMDU3_IPLC00004G0112 [Thermoplasmatales archaeon I-plasma]MCL5930071.1 hypothetical protein [Candidatus Thermoplasmatota archaeon]